jgi:hypothetical protein
MDKITKLVISLSTISTVILTVLIVAVSIGYAQIDFNLNDPMSEESTPLNPFFISRDVADTLNKNYESSDREFAACLNIEQSVNKLDSSLEISYMIDSLDSDIQFFGKSFSTMGYCDRGVIHSHPKGSCFFSIADIHSFKDRIAKGEYFSALMCGEDKFVYITRNDFTEKELKII